MELTVKNCGEHMSEFGEICCGDCKYHRNEAGEWFCMNTDSEMYGCETDYNDYCDDHEERSK